MANLELDIKDYLNYACMGNGTGYLATVKSYTYSNGVATVVCNNTYSNSGWDNVSMIQPGQLLDVYDSTLASKKIAAKVATAVTPGKRSADTAYAAVDGTVVISGLSADPSLVAGDYIIWANCLNKMPMGLVGIVQGNYVDNSLPYTGLMSTTSFQSPMDNSGNSIARSSLASMNAKVYNAKVVGLKSEGPVAGVPGYWDIQNISDAMSDIAEGSSRGHVTDLIMGQRMAMCLSRRAGAAHNLNAQKDSMDAATMDQPVGSRYPTKFTTPDGNIARVRVIPNFPDYVIYGINANDLVWFTHGKNWDYDNVGGGIWRYDGTGTSGVMASVRGYSQIGAKRCDSCFVLQDLRSDL
jgi:hypothetical protein